MKIVCMIPARLGSQRVKNKNLKLLGDKPLIKHIIHSAKQVKYFDNIYINSESSSQLTIFCGNISINFFFIFCFLKISEL